MKHWPGVGAHTIEEESMSVIHDGKRYDLDDLAHYLDPDQRELVHLDLSPCDPQVWWDEYVSRYRDDADHTAACAPVLRGTS